MIIYNYKNYKLLDGIFSNKQPLLFINGFSLDQEYFGFNQYKSSPKSNLDFMYFTKVEETEDYKKELRYHNDMVDNIKESGLPQGEIDKQLREEEKWY